MMLGVMESPSELGTQVSSAPSPPGRRNPAGWQLGWIWTILGVLLGLITPTVGLDHTAADLLEGISARVHTGMGVVAVPKGLAVLQSRQVFLPMVTTLDIMSTCPRRFRPLDGTRCVPSMPTAHALAHRQQMILVSRQSQGRGQPAICRIGIESSRRSLRRCTTGRLIRFSI